MSVCSHGQVVAGFRLLSQCCDIHIARHVEFDGNIAAALGNAIVHAVHRTAGLADGDKLGLTVVAVAGQLDVGDFLVEVRRIGDGILLSAIHGSRGIGIHRAGIRAAVVVVLVQRTIPRIHGIGRLGGIYRHRDVIIQRVQPAEGIFLIAVAVRVLRDLVLRSARESVGLRLVQIGRREDLVFPACRRNGNGCQSLCAVSEQRNGIFRGIHALVCPANIQVDTSACCSCRYAQTGCHDHTHEKRQHSAFLASSFHVSFLLSTILLSQMGYRCLHCFLHQLSCVKSWYWVLLTSSPFCV